MKLNAGQIAIAQLIGWGIVVAVPTALASVGFSNMQIEKLFDAQTEIVQRVSVIETESKEYRQDIVEINKKLDLIIRELK